MSGAAEPDAVAVGFSPTTPSSRRVCQSTSALGAHSTRLGSAGYSCTGTVMNWMFLTPMSFTLDASSFIVPRSNCSSVVSDLVAASRKPNSLSGRTSSEVRVASCTTDDRKAC